MNQLLKYYNDDLSKLIDLNIINKYKQIVIITDNIVYDIYKSKINIIEKYCSNINIKCYVYYIENGEKSKNIKTKIEIENYMFKNNIKRKNSCLIALGGGVVGDLVGYVASTYKRGIDFIQIPTTILAMVDSSIGGKNGINNSYGKNMIGSIYKPKNILIFLDFIESLPEVEIINGFAEIIKTAIINNIDLWNILIKNNIDSVLNNKNLLFEIIKLTSLTKLKIVKDDIYEKKNIGCSRSHLNFGHTIGHIIEYVNKLKHGFAISIGMVLELSLKENNKYIVPINIRSKIKQCLKNYKLPIKLKNSIDIEDIIKYLNNDKKDNNIILIEDIGKSYTKKYTLNQIIECIKSDRIITHKNIINPNSEFITYIAPSSKSATNRVLILSALGRGQSIIKNALFSDDTIHMIESLKKLGFNIKIFSNDIIVNGIDSYPIELNFKEIKNLYIGNSGTSIRFLICLLLILRKGKCIIKGDERMKKRPINHLISSLKEFGMNIYYNNNKDIEIIGTKYNLLNEINLDCSLSSQYLSGLLMIGASMPNGLKINILNNIVSEKFIKMTLKIMKKFNIDFEIIYNNNGFPKKFIVHNKKYINPKIYEIEGDATSCNYPIIYSILNKINLYIPNLKSNNNQGDLYFSTELIKKFGNFTINSNINGTKIFNYNGVLNGIGTIDMDSSDTFLSIAILASLSNGFTKLTNINNQNLKESNRVDILYKYLKEAGVNIKKIKNKDNIELHIEGHYKQKLNDLYINSHNDHRISMCFSLLNQFMNKLIISDCNCVNKTYERFWFDMSKLGMINKINNDIIII